MFHHVAPTEINFLDQLNRCLELKKGHQKRTAYTCPSAMNQKNSLLAHDLIHATYLWH